MLLKKHYNYTVPQIVKLVLLSLHSVLIQHQMKLINYQLKLNQTHLSIMEFISEYTNITVLYQLVN